MTGPLTFGIGNKKLTNAESTFSLPSGYTCPGAKDCLTKAKPDGRIQDGRESKYRCFSASQETYHPPVRKSRWNNFVTLKKKSMAEMALMIHKSLPQTVLHRIHVSGDFFSQDYFDAWLKVAKRNPRMSFYTYTKSLPFLVKRLNKLPPNITFVASRGGKFDYLIDKYNLRECVIVESKYQARKLKLKIDKDDSLAQNPNIRKFALLLHGNGKPGSKQAKMHNRKIRGIKGWHQPKIEL